MKLTPGINIPAMPSPTFSPSQSCRRYLDKDSPSAICEFGNWSASSKSKSTGHRSTSGGWCTSESTGQIWLKYFEILISAYCQTWVNDNLWIATTCLQRPPTTRSQFNILLLKWPLHNNRLSTTVTILECQGWSLYTGLTVFGYDFRFNLILKLEN